MGKFQGGSDCNRRIKPEPIESGKRAEVSHEGISRRSRNQRAPRLSFSASSASAWTCLFCYGLSRVHAGRQSSVNRLSRVCNGAPEWRLARDVRTDSLSDIETIGCETNQSKNNDHENIRQIHFCGHCCDSSHHRERLRQRRRVALVRLRQRSRRISRASSERRMVF
jgi:hypothetical protein